MLLALILAYLSFHSLFWDADRRLCVKLQASARLSFFPDDVSVEQTSRQTITTHIILLGNKTSHGFQVGENTQQS